MRPYITTFTGKHLNPLDPAFKDIDIRDIAHALALVPRFAGHTQEPISIAQHSIYVSRLCAGTPYALHGLLHDASEAYLGDVTKWLKMSPAFRPYRVAEAHVQSLIFERFECAIEDPVDAAVHGSEGIVDWADKLMVRYEAERLLPGHQFPSNYPATTQEERDRVGPWEPWSWQTAETLFLLRFDALCANGRWSGRSVLPAGWTLAQGIRRQA